MKVRVGDKIYILKDWTPGCLGLKYPAVVVSADTVIYRESDDHGIEVLVGTRGEGRWQAGMPTLTFGGFINPDDPSARDAMIREVSEELPGLRLDFSDLPIFITGPLKFGYRWDPFMFAPVTVGELVQDIPIITLNYLAKCLDGEPQPTKEVPEVKWTPLVELLSTKQQYAFDHALLLPVLFKYSNY